MQVIVYGSESPRLKYLVEVFCTEYFGHKWELSSNVSEFLASDCVKINYSEEYLTGVFQIVPSGFMSETSIRKFCPTYIKNDECHELFPNSSELGFDMFSAIFYLLSRYEEYVIEERDIHDRFTAQQSLAFHNGFLDQPIIDHWLINLRKRIENHYDISLSGMRDMFDTIPTFDLDNAYAFIGKGFARNLGGLFKDMFSARFVWVKRRFSTWRSKNNDPYNTYDYILKQIENHQGIFFLPLGRRGPFDKNVYWKNTDFKSLVKRISSKHEVGIHPSYNSNYLTSILETEFKRFEKINKKPAIKSRQHYLKLSLPDTYQRLLQMGVKHDYTMGYANLPGFRAGIARSYLWYDLSEESTTDLRVHPFMYMDGTFNDYMSISVDKAIEIMSDLKFKTQAVHGEFVFIWHNDSLRDTDNWTNWRKLFEASL